jgi:tetratricopeptide (TPR) repeat protein
MLWANGRPDSAARLATASLADATEPWARASVIGTQADLASARGQLSEAERLSAQVVTLQREAGSPGNALAVALGSPVRTGWYRGDRASAARQLDEALKANPLTGISLIDRPFKELVDAQVLVGRIDAAKATLADFMRASAALGAVPDTNTRTQLEGVVAMGEKKYDLAAAKFRERTVDKEFSCGVTCEWPRLAQAYDLGGKPDSAIAVFERYVQNKDWTRLAADVMYLGPSLKRLGELYEAKGDRNNAAKQYAQFVELWKNADPELQPTVKDVQGRLSRLRGAEPVKQVTPGR